MRGKDKCRILKQLRKDIADRNGIEYQIEECKFKGECKGTCPKCEAELLKLPEQVKKKREKAGLVGLGAGVLALGLVGCTNIDSGIGSNSGNGTLSGDVVRIDESFIKSETETNNNVSDIIEDEGLSGEVEENVSESDTDIIKDDSLSGLVSVIDTNIECEYASDEFELSGDVVYIEDIGEYDE